MYPVINIFGKQIGTYAVCAVLGFIVSAIFASKKAKKFGITPEDMVKYYLIAGAGILIGGHLLFGIVNIDLTVNAFNNLFDISQNTNILKLFADAFGGSVFYGGLFGSAILLYIALRTKEKKEKDIVFGIYSISIPLFHTFGRIGCFLGGCCYGIESKLGFVAKNNPFIPEVCEVRRFPAALLEAGANMFIFLILLSAFKTEKRKSRIFFYYGILYSFSRFFIEFLRGDKLRGIFLNLSTSQWISILFFIFCFVSLVMISKKEVKNE